MRKALRHTEQVLGSCTRESVDRLVVVADHAEVVPRPQPPVEQCLLEQVDVLVLVDGERDVPLAEFGDGALVVEGLDRALEQILEVHQPLSCFRSSYRR